MMVGILAVDDCSPVNQSGDIVYILSRNSAARYHDNDKVP